MAWGGTRRGAGRPRNPIKRIGRTIRLSDEEFLSLKTLDYGHLRQIMINDIGNNVLEMHEHIHIQINININI